MSVSARPRGLALIATACVSALVISACSATGAIDQPDTAGGSTGKAGPSAVEGESANPENPDTRSGANGGVGVRSDDDPAVTTIGLAEPYVPTASGQGTDDYRCFLIDLDFPTDQFVTGVRFAPGNPAVVHHAIVYRVEPDQVEAARAKDAEDSEQGWSCFGGPGLPTSSSEDALSAIQGNAWLAAWAPGGRESRTPEGTGVPVSAGSAAVLQVHYNMRGGQGPDLTQVQLRTEPGSADLIPLDTYLLPAPVELPCLPDESGPLCDREAAVTDVIERFGGESLRTIWGLQFICDGDLVNPKAGSTQTCEHTARSDMQVYAAGGHMHLLGRSLTIDHVSASGESRILDIENWDFDNQARSWFDTPVEVARGDILRVSCTHDASLRRSLPELAELPPRHVVWGDGTADEMCLGILTVARV
jgi:hypothetical protein